MLLATGTSAEEPKESAETFTQAENQADQNTGVLQGMALKLGQMSWGAGTTLANTTLGALWATTKTVGLVPMTLADFGKPLWRMATPQKPLAPVSPVTQIPLPAGYSPTEKTVVCNHCGQNTLIRGELPGLKITCPSCGKPIS